MNADLAPIGRLSKERYLACFADDLDAILRSPTDLAARVPGCPDWNVRDLLSHLIGVYRHKIAALTLGTQPPAPTEGDWGDLPDGEDPRAVLRATAEDLRVRLAVGEPDAPAWSWWPPEQTIGFWHRRMAQETAVHRWDLQSADGIAEAAPIPEDLALDGIDELLGWMTWDWSEMQQPQAAGQRVAVSSGDRVWQVSLQPTSVGVARLAGEARDAAALISGAPSDLLLHLWGRPIDAPITASGDPVALGLLRERLAAATT